MTFRHELRAHRRLLGVMISEIRNPNIAVMLHAAEMDFMIIDMEHGVFDWSDMGAMVTVARGTRVSPLVRIPELRREPVIKCLDAGAAGVVVPMVESAEQAAEAVRLVKYPPMGDRGVTLRRAHNEYRTRAMKEYFSQANEQTVVIVQIETAAALERVEAIAAVPGLDGLLVGPADLAASRGHPERIWDAELRDLYKVVQVSARRHGLAAGIQAVSRSQAAGVIGDGFSFISVTSDVRLIVDGAAAEVIALSEA